MENINIFREDYKKIDTESLLFNIIKKDDIKLFKTVLNCNIIDDKISIIESALMCCMKYNAYKILYHIIKDNKNCTSHHRDLIIKYAIMYTNFKLFDIMMIFINYEKTCDYLLDYALKINNLFMVSYITNNEKLKFSSPNNLLWLSITINDDNNNYFMLRELLSDDRFNPNFNNNCILIHFIHNNNHEMVNYLLKFNRTVINNGSIIMYITLVKNDKKMIDLLMNSDINILQSTNIKYKYIVFEYLMMKNLPDDILKRLLIRPECKKNIVKFAHWLIKNNHYYILNNILLLNKEFIPIIKHIYNGDIKCE